MASDALKNAFNEKVDEAIAAPRTTGKPSLLIDFNNAFLSKTTVAGPGTPVSELYSTWTKETAEAIKHKFASESFLFKKAYSPSETVSKYAPEFEPPEFEEISGLLEQISEISEFPRNYFNQSPYSLFEEMDFDSAEGDGIDNTQTPECGRPLVNYIWINKQKAETDPDEPVCAINLGNIKRAVENANRYPDADFRIWVDKKLLDEYSLFCLESFIGDNSQGGNIAIHDLQDIPDYANDPYFVPLETKNKGYLTYVFDRSGPRNVYSRADYARILVLDHCMQNCPEQSRIIYSDIDCPDIRVKEALDVIKQHAVVIYDIGQPVVSHGYIGIAANNNCVREHFQDLKARAATLAHNNSLGWTAFQKFLGELAMPLRLWHAKIGLPGLLPEMGTVPDPVAYTPSRDFQAWKQRAAPANSL